MKFKYQFALNEIGGQTVAVPVGEQTVFNGFIKLNETAAFIFKQLDTDVTREELVDRLMAQFGCEKAYAEENVDYILDGLRKSNLLVE